MNQEAKQRWIAELRSGKHTQGRAALNRNGNKCCLGVLCEVTPGIERHKEEFEYGEWQIEYAYKDDERRSGFLPDRLRQEVGLTKNEQTHLSKLNDLENKTFAEIADWIEGSL